MEAHHCTSGMERILAAQGRFICLPLPDEAAKAISADRSVGWWTVAAIVVACGMLLLCCMAAARVVWGSCCHQLSPPFFCLLPLRLLGGLRRAGSNAGDPDQDLTAVSVVLSGGGTLMYRTAIRGPTGPYVPQPMGGNVLVNPHFDPNYYDTSAAKTSTPLKVCSKGSVASDAWSLTPQFAGRREGSIGWISLQDVASGAGSIKSECQGAVDGDEAAVGGAGSTRSLPEVYLDSSTQPLVAEAAPIRLRPRLPRRAKTKGRDGLYRDPDDPYRRFSK